MENNNDLFDIIINKSNNNLKQKIEKYLVDKNLIIFNNSDILDLICVIEENDLFNCGYFTVDCICSWSSNYFVEKKDYNKLKKNNNLISFIETETIVHEDYLILDEVKIYNIDWQCTDYLKDVISEDDIYYLTQFSFEVNTRGNYYDKYTNCTKSYNFSNSYNIFLNILILDDIYCNLENDRDVLLYDVLKLSIKENKININYFFNHLDFVNYMVYRE